MDNGYMLQSQTRSMSSLASTILPLPSDPSNPTPAAGSATDPGIPHEIPVELTIPLPPSSTCSEDGQDDIAPLEMEPGPKTHATLRSEDDDQHRDSESLLAPSLLEELQPGTEEKPTPAGVPGRSASLDRLQSLVTLEKSHNVRARLLRKRLRDLRLRCGLERRLLNTLADAHRSMYGQFRNKDQAAFVRSYEVCEELTKGTSAMFQTAEETDSYNDDIPSSDAKAGSTWMHVLPSSQLESLLGFFTQIRNDPTYLASCLCKLSSAELSALTSSYRSEPPISSVLPDHQPNKARGPSRRFPSNPDAASTARFQGFCQDDPLFTIFHGIFDESSMPESWEFNQKIEVLSTACAGIMVGGKRGSDDLATIFLDACSGLQITSAQPRFEEYLLKVLQNGSFILDMPLDNFGSLEQPIEIQNANAAIATSNFYERCLADLFSLLADELPQIVTASTIRFVQAVLGKIEDPAIRNRAKNFIVSKWFFCSFVPNILIYPESSGLMMRHHVGDTARDELLKPLAVRMQKQVLGVVLPWNRHSIVDPKAGVMIEKIFSYFEPTQSAAAFPLNQDRCTEGYCPTANASIILSPRTVVGLIRTLLPPAPPSPGSADLTYSENASTASSVAASSTLTSGSLGFGSAMPSSQAPSISGTSMTSATILSECPLAGPDSGHSQAAHGDIHHENVPFERDSNDCSATVVEVCQAISVTVDSQLDSVPKPNVSDWALVEICEKRLQLFSTAVDSQELNVQGVSDDLQGSDTRLPYALFDELEEAISMVVDNPHLWTGSGFFDQSSVNDTLCTLNRLLDSAMTDCESRFDYRTAHFWWRNIQTLKELSRLQSSENAVGNLLDRIAERKTTAIERYTGMIEVIGSKVHCLEMLAAHQRRQLQAMDNRRKALRAKMWYILDVRHSAAYEDALNVTQALRLMADSKRRSKKQSATTSWARQRLRSSDTNDRTPTQVLEALASPLEYGGLPKLADNQVEATTRWMTKNSIENFCKGEELIHRFCHEIQRCVSRLAAVNMLDSPVLWSSDLYKPEKGMFNSHRAPPYTIQDANDPWEGRWRTSNFNSSSFKPVISPFSSMPLESRNTAVNAPKSIHSFWQAKKPASNFMEGIPYFKQAHQSQPKSPASMLPPNSARSYPTAQQLSNPSISENLSGSSTREFSKAHKAFADDMRNTVTALLLSDLGYLLWSRGTETDIWINEHMLGTETRTSAFPQISRTTTEPLSVESSSALSDALSDSTITISHHNKAGDQSSPQPTPIDSLEYLDLSHRENEKDSPTLNRNASPRQAQYPFPDAFARILRKFSSSSDPFVKLELLAELESIVLLSVCSAYPSQSRDYPAGFRNENATGTRGTNIPRTKATSLEEVMANCTERRAGTMKYTAPNTPERRSLGRSFHQPDTDEVVNALLEIFRDEKLRPPTLYRDLQFIAAFVPSDILDQSAKGKAFWDVGLAALGYKEDRCEAMIHRANQITNYHVSANKDTSSFMNAYSSDLIDTSLGDAAQLWVIVAKEGSPVACRELGLFYLTHPELLPRVTLPFSKSKDVFKSVTSSDRTSIDTGGLDPLTFAVVFHWMELAANGGDKDARDFIRGNGELR